MPETTAGVRIKEEAQRRHIFADLADGLEDGHILGEEIAAAYKQQFSKAEQEAAPPS